MVALAVLGAAVGMAVAPTDAEEVPDALSIHDQPILPIISDGTPGEPDITQRIDAERVIAQAASHFGERFGGSWVADEGETLAIGIVRRQVADSQWLRDTSGTAEVLGIDVEFGASQLQAWADHVNEVAGRHRVRGIMIGPYQPNNTVLVEGRAIPDEFRREASAGLPAGALRFREDPTFAMEPAHSSRSNWNSIVVHNEAGLAVNIDFEAMSCTTGFVVSNGYGLFGTTAGHCARNGIGSTVRAPDGSFTDHVRLNLYTSEAGPESDALLFSTNPIYNYGRVMRAVTSHPGVMGMFSEAGPTAGTQNICRIGKKSDNERCGTITRARARFWDERNNKDVLVWCINQASAPGDSGGPVYRHESGKVRAAGLVHGAATIDGVNSTCYTHIHWLLAKSGSGLVLG